jgi:hypothetical protein
MSINCDLPAIKKVCGFTAFNSFIPCHKCSDRYPGQPGRPQARDCQILMTVLGISEMVLQTVNKHYYEEMQERLQKEEYWSISTVHGIASSIAWSILI